MVARALLKPVIITARRGAKERAQGRENTFTANGETRARPRGVVKSATNVRTRTDLMPVFYIRLTRPLPCGCRARLRRRSFSFTSRTRRPRLRATAFLIQTGVRPRLRNAHLGFARGSSSGRETAKPNPRHDTFSWVKSGFGEFLLNIPQTTSHRTLSLSLSLSASICITMKQLGVDSLLLTAAELYRAPPRYPTRSVPRERHLRIDRN